MEFDNMGFDEDDYDYDEDKAETSFIDEQEFQRTLNTQYKALDPLIGSDRETHKTSLMKMMMKQFFEINQEPIRSDSYKLPWELKEDEFGRPVFSIRTDKDYPLSYYRGNSRDAEINFYKLDTLQGKYGVDFVRKDLGIDDYQSHATRVRAGRKELSQLIAARDKIATEEIPIQDISSPQEAQNVIDAVDEYETAVKTVVETSFIDTPTKTIIGTQTKIDMREMNGILEAMTTEKGHIALALPDLNETNKNLAKEKGKLEEAIANNYEKKIIDDIKQPISNLEIERSGILEVINVNKEKLRSQVFRIKETIDRVLNKDTTLRERIRTLFREQGITIVSVLTAFGMIIGVIVETFIPSGSATTPPPPNKPSSGVKDWVKNNYQILVNY